jgi:sortase (surface protein transpeptidase)
MTAGLVIVGSITSAVYFGTHLQVRPNLNVPVKSSSVTAALTPSSPRTVALSSEIRRQEKVNLLKPVAAPAPKPKPTPLPTVMTRSLPLRIVIPKIQLDTSVFSEGLGVNKSISMPDIFDQVGWYNKSPTPGERGPAVLTGHVDSTQGIAIFWNLRYLMPGDIIKIERQDGTTATFRVTKVGQFPQDQFPTQAVYGPIPYAGIRLITCGGTFNTATGHYDQNTVVYGRLINQ